MTVRVQLADAVRGRVGPEAPLFVFVRDAAGGPPLAVVRKRAAELPLAVRISDADIMVPGRTLAGVQRAKVVARVANGGDPVARAGDVFGEADWTSSSAEVSVVVDKVVP
jgi:cytochrome c-type biogenesis protein CcmH